MEATANNRPYDVLATGPYFVDMIFNGLPEFPQLGKDIFSSTFDLVPGGMFYTVLALHRLGVRTGWTCNLGTDLFSRAILEAAEAEGIDNRLFHHHERPVRRLAASFSFKHDRGFVSYLDQDVEELISLAELERVRPRCLMLAGLDYVFQVPQTSRLPNRAEFVVYQDCQHTDLTLESSELTAALRHVDIFAPNEVEAMQLTGADTVEEALERLAAVVPLVVVKCGAKGALARRADAVYRAPAIDVNVQDTTGAGDCFNAGFVFGYLRGEPLENCLRLGNIVGGLSTTAPGSSGVPDRARTLEMLEHYPAHCR